MITQCITLDFTRKYLTPIYLNQYEADSRDFVITCKSGDLPIDLSGASVVFYAKKPDDNILFNACAIADATAGKIRYTPTSQTCAAAGAMTCQIVITAADLSVLRSMEFIVTVNAGDDYSEAVESTSEFTALEDALALVSGHEARITQNEDDIEALTPALSLEQDENGLHLVNDEATPSDRKFYGSESGVKGFFAAHNYAWLTKSADQTISAVDNTTVTFDGFGSCGNGSLYFARDGNKLKCIKACTAIVKAQIQASLNISTYLAATINKNSGYFANAYGNRSVNGTPVLTTYISTTPIECAVNDYFEILARSDDTDGYDIQETQKTHFMVEVL